MRKTRLLPLVWAFCALAAHAQAPHSFSRFGRENGFGWALLTTPEYLLGHEACQCERTPMESYERMQQHLARLLPFASQQQIDKMLK